jgi:hypothetical protein
MTAQLKMHDLLTRRLLGESMPDRFTMVDGKNAVRIDKIVVTNHEVMFRADNADVLVLEIPFQSRVSEDVLYISIDDLYLGFTLT